MAATKPYLADKYYRCEPLTIFKARLSAFGQTHAPIAVMIFRYADGFLPKRKWCSWETADQCMPTSPLGRWLAVNDGIVWSSRNPSCRSPNRKNILHVNMRDYPVPLLI
jgi:hypothetical protein